MIVIKNNKKGSPFYKILYVNVGARRRLFQFSTGFLQYVYENKEGYQN